jgi:hypothetical protein
MAVRAKSINQLYSQKAKILKLDGIYSDVLGSPEAGGAWLIWGSEKNGKTWFALKLADYLSGFIKVLYISAEEGTGPNFINTCKRANLQANNRSLQFTEYMSISELVERIDKRRSPQAIFIDNTTIYQNELKNGGVRKLLARYPGKLFVFIAHEDRGEPYTAQAKLISKLAKVVVYIRGLMCVISGRVPGGTLMIDEQRAQLYHQFKKEDNDENI